MNEGLPELDEPLEAGAGDVDGHDLGSEALSASLGHPVWLRQLVQGALGRSGQVRSVVASPGSLGHHPVRLRQLVQGALRRSGQVRSEVRSDQVTRPLGPAVAGRRPRYGGS